MNTDTGEMFTPKMMENLTEKQDKLRMGGVIIDIPHEFVDELSNMNRKERRRFYRTNKKRMVKVVEGGETK